MGDTNNQIVNKYFSAKQLPLVLAIKEGYVYILTIAVQEKCTFDKIKQFYFNIRKAISNLDRNASFNFVR